MANQSRSHSSRPIKTIEATFRTIASQHMIEPSQTPLSGPRIMALHFTISEWIGASPNVVYGVATNLELAGKWMPNFVRMEKLTRGEFGPGTRFRETRKMFGKTQSEVFEVVEASPPKRVRLFVDGSQGASRRGRFDFDFQFEPVDDGTRVTLSGSLSQLTWIWELLARLFMRSMRKSCEAELRAMKTYIESQNTVLRHSTAMMPAFTPRDAVQAVKRPE